MQFNSNLIQSLLGKTQKGNTSVVDSSNMLVTPVDGVVGEFSNEFHALLNETKALAESGVTPEEFIETLDAEDLGLSGGEKKALTQSFIDALNIDGEELASTLSGTGLEQKNIPQVKSGNSHSALAAIINNNQSANVTAEAANLNTKVMTDEVTKSSSEAETLESSVDPKISNGKLISLKEHSAKNIRINNIQSSEDFIAQSKTISKETSENLEEGLNKMTTSNTKNKVLAFNKEQNSINNSIFTGKNPFVSGNETKVVKNSSESESVVMDQLNNNVKAEGLIAPVLNQSNNSNNNSQTSFGSNTNVKVLDFTNLGTTNTEQLIDKISNYITTSRLEKQEHVELIVKHDSLGHVKVTASKGQLPDQINLEIVANTEKGHQFFKANEIEMIKSLSNSGVKLSDVKISMGSDFNFQSSEKGDSQFNQGQGSQHSKYNGQQASSGHDQGRRDRREQMWNMYRERMGA